VVAFAACLGLLLAWRGWRIDAMVGYGGTVLAASAIVTWILLRRWRGESEPSFVRAAIALCLFVLIAVRSDAVLTRQPLLDRPSAEVVQAIREEGDPPCKVAGFEMEAGIASQAAVISGGTIHIDRFKEPTKEQPFGYKITDLLAYDLILYNSKDFLSPPLPSEYALMPVGRYIPSWQTIDVVNVMLGRTTKEKVWQRRKAEFYVLASRPRALRRTPTTYPSVLPEDQSD
jgi:hypothetical protein